MGKKLKLHPLPLLLWAAAPKWITPSFRHPYSAEQAFTLKGEVLSVRGAAESRRSPLWRTENQTAVSPAQQVSKMPIVKVRIELLSKGCANAISNGLKSITTM